MNSEQRAFHYDRIGNREISTAAGLQTSYTPNDLNQYDAVGPASPIHDDDGNLLHDATSLLAYNAENQLKSITVSGISVSTYQYDYIGRRVKATVDVLDGSGPDYVVTWVYSGWNKLEERKIDGSSTSAKNLVWGLDLSRSMEGAGGVGGLLAVEDGAGLTRLLSYDGNGNVTELLAADSGAVQAHYEYDPFGNIVCCLSRYSTARAPRSVVSRPR